LEGSNPENALRGRSAMTERRGLDERLRAALGSDGPVATGPSRWRTGTEAAKAAVIAGIHRRRVRRLQIAGMACLVAVGLAVSLPQVLGNTTPTNHFAAKNGARAPAASPVHGAATGTASPATSSGTVATASCHVGGRLVSDCGVLASGSGGQKLQADAGAVSSTYAAMPPGFTSSLGKTLVVRAGDRVVVALPRLKTGWQWAKPEIVDTGGVSSVAGLPVVVRATMSRGTTERFVITTTSPTTVVLEAQQDVYKGPAGEASTHPGSTAVWVLVLRVEAR
jgi:hypothetical protein